jgi:hypothetical protein
MQVIVEIPDPLAAQARQRGLSPEAFAQSLIDEAAKTPPGVSDPRSPEQILAFFSSMSQDSEGLPDLPTASFTRASYYQDGD